jgi:hypothetical protein
VRIGSLLAVLLVAPPALAAPPRADVHVDSRVELLSVLFYLAGAPEYLRAYDTPYRRAVDADFGAFKDHAAVVATKDLRARYGVSHNAPPGLAVQLDGELAARVSLDPWPEGVDARWRKVALPAYLEQVRAFARDSGWSAFFAGQKRAFAAVEGRFAAALKSAGIDAWFDGTFGPRRGASFFVCPGMLTGPWSYSATTRLGGDREEVYQIVALEKLDAESLPVPTAETIDLVVHERAHAYVNPVVQSRASELSAAADPVFASAKAVMERQSYRTPTVMVQESIVRALRVLYVRDRRGAQGEKDAIRDEESRGFVWTAALAERLASLKGKGRLDLARHVPELAAFFADWAKKVAPSPARP